MRFLTWIFLSLLIPAFGQTPSATTCGNPQQTSYVYNNHFYICTNGVPFQVDGGGGTTTNPVTFNNGGAGAASGTAFNGSSAVTVSYNTLGAASSGANSNITSLSGLTTPLSVAQGGTGTGATLVGLLRGNASAFTATELSGDVTTSGSNVATVVQVEGASIPASAVVVGTNSSRQLTSPTTTGSGNVVLATSPTLVTPALGTPSSVNLANATGLPTTGLTGTLQAAQFPALTGDCTTTAGALATTCSNINGTAFPTSAVVIGSNGSAQPTATTVSGTGSTIPTTASPTFTGTVTIPTLQGIASTTTGTMLVEATSSLPSGNAILELYATNGSAGNGQAVVQGGAGGATGIAVVYGGSSAAGANTNYVVLAPTSNSVGGLLSLHLGKGGGVSGGLGETESELLGVADSTNYQNPVYQFYAKNGSHTSEIFEIGEEGGYDSSGYPSQVTGQAYGTDHLYTWDAFNALGIWDYQPALTLANATTTTSSNTVSYTGSFGRASVGDQIFGTGCGLPGTTPATFGTIATITAGTGFTYTGTAVTTGATCNIYVTHPQTGMVQHVLFENGVSFYQPSTPTVTSCSSGTISSNATDNVFSVTGISSGTACTVTTQKPLLQNVCVASTNQASTPVRITSITTSTTNTVVAFEYSSLNGTLYATCF